jgi:hypothetical protein
MAKDLNQLISWLQGKETNRFEIHDVDAEAPISKCISFNDMAKTHGDAETYFEDLMRKGIKVVQIQRKTKNGSTFKRVGCGLNFALSSEDENNFVAASGTTGNAGATQQQPMQPTLQPPTASGLMGAASGMGLSIPQFLTMSNQAERYKDAESHKRELEERVKTLEAENKALEKENLKHELGLQAKPSGVEKLFDVVATNPELLSAIPAMFGKANNGTAPSLNAPAQPELSPSKAMLVDWLSSKAEITDQHAEVCRFILTQSLIGNQTFVDSLNELITQSQQQQQQAV